MAASTRLLDRECQHTAFQHDELGSYPNASVEVQRMNTGTAIPFKWFSNWSPERLSKLSKVTIMGSGRMYSWTLAGLAPKWGSSFLVYSMLDERETANRWAGGQGNLSHGGRAGTVLEVICWRRLRSEQAFIIWMRHENTFNFIKIYFTFKYNYI